jgi:alpha,alpha-trehalase
VETLTLSINRFGWVNASFVYGLEILNAHQRRALGAITAYETYNKAVAIQDDA